MIKPQFFKKKIKQDSYLECNNTLHTLTINNLIFKRNINTQSLSPKSPTIAKEAINQSVPNISPKPDNVNPETIDNAIKYLSDNNTNQELTVRLKRKSSDTLSDQGPSGENALIKKPKLSHEYENENENTILDSIELDTNYVVETAPQIETQISEVASTSTNYVAETTLQLESQIRDLSINMENHSIVKNEAYRLIDDIQTTITLLEDYMENITAHIEEIEQSLYAHTRDNENIDIDDLESNADMPRLMSDESLSSVSSHSHSNDWDLHSEQDMDNNPELNILDLEDIDEDILEENFNEDNNFDQNNITLDQNYLDNEARIFEPLPSDNISIVDENVGMEPLNNGVPSSDVIFSGQMRSDNIIHNNYSIHMSGKDDIDYRMAFEYLKECLDNLDKLIVEHQALISLENNILPVCSDLIVQASTIEVEISSILEILSHWA